VKRICVFCGASPGSSPEYLAAARALGKALAQAGLELVYGGASVGLMGAVADSVLEHRGRVIGVIPQALVDRELAHSGLSDLQIVGSMHERKARMEELSDGFIALPGGFGTLDEFCEILTWAVLGIHGKPCGLLNVKGYYDGFLNFVDHATTQGFISIQDRRRILSDENHRDLLTQFHDYQAPEVKRWIRDQSQT
jgi:uncharacterized protein (TIGR00730 family)